MVNTISAKKLKVLVGDIKCGRTTYIEPFLGGGNSFAAVAPLFDNRLAGDIDADITTMWRHVAQGWLPPEDVSEETYNAYKNDPNPQEDDPLRGYIAFGVTFGGTKWGCYGRKSKTPIPRNSYRSVTRDAHVFKGADIRTCDYAAWNPGPDAVVYCDPPYIGTRRYKGPKFDHAHFWTTADSWVQAGALVLVSEHIAPDHWIPILSSTRFNTLDVHGSGHTRAEYVFQARMQVESVKSSYYSLNIA